MSIRNLYDMSGDVSFSCANDLKINGQYLKDRFYPLSKSDKLEKEFNLIKQKLNEQLGEVEFNNDYDEKLEVLEAVIKDLDKKTNEDKNNLEKMLFKFQDENNKNTQTNKNLLFKVNDDTNKLKEQLVKLEEVIKEKKQDISKLNLSLSALSDDNAIFKEDLKQELVKQNKQIQQVEDNNKTTNLKLMSDINKKMNEIEYIKKQINDKNNNLEQKIEEYKLLVETNNPENLGEVKRDIIQLTKKLNIQNSQSLEKDNNFKKEIDKINKAYTAQNNKYVDLIDKIEEMNKKLSLFSDDFNNLSQMEKRINDLLNKTQDNTNKRILLLNKRLDNLELNI